MIKIPDYVIEFYRDVKPQTGYIYYFLDENLKNVSRDQIKIGIGFYRSGWIDGAFLFESDSYLLKSIKEYLAAAHLEKGKFPVWAEWTKYYSRLWAAVGISRLMGMGSFYLTGHGPVMILRKHLSDIPGTIDLEVAEVRGEESPESDEAYLVYRDPGGGAHLRNWKLFYVVLTEILHRSGQYQIDEEVIQAMSSGDPESRFVIKREEEIYGFPSLYKVWELSEAEAAKLERKEIQSLDEWIENEAQFDAGGFTEEFKAYYKFMMDQYTRDDELPDVLSLIEHGVTWLLAVLPEDLRTTHRDRYFELVNRFAADEETKRQVTDWLEKITKV